VANDDDTITFTGNGTSGDPQGHTWNAAQHPETDVVETIPKVVAEPDMTKPVMTKPRRRRRASLYFMEQGTKPFDRPRPWRLARWRSASSRAMGVT
jgi:hypothetical protein